VKRITATEASRSFSRVLDAAEHGGKSFLVERNRRAVAELRPAPKTSTVGDLLAFLRDVGMPAPDFRADMLDIIELSARVAGDASSSSRKPRRPSGAPRDGHDCDDRRAGLVRSHPRRHDNGAVDPLIAAAALECDPALATLDVRLFDRVSGLRVITP
jgi:predicted nucleic acid-binding protein